MLAISSKAVKTGERFKDLCGESTVYTVTLTEWVNDEWMNEFIYMEIVEIFVILIVEMLN